MNITTESFRGFVQQAAMKSLSGALPQAEAQRIAAQTALGFFAAMRTAKNPQDIVDCTPASILSAIATSVSTRLVVGTPNAPAYLVPQRARRDAPLELQFRINHRGWAILFLRAGFVLDPVPVGWDDQLELDNGLVKLAQNPDAMPASWEQLRGVAVFATHIESGTRLSAWVPVAVIEQRRKTARQDYVWSAWPVEMAMGAAIRYCVARGKLPVDSMAVSAALDAENTPSVIEADSEPVSRSTAIPSGREALGLVDHGEPIDELAGARPAEREAIPAESELVEQPAVEAAPESLVAGVQEWEDAAMTKGGTDAVREARAASGIDPNGDLGTYDASTLRAYRKRLSAIAG